MNIPRQLWVGTLVVFVVRTAYAGLVHGPLFLTPLVYARFPTAMAPAMNLPALLGVEALITVLFVGAYRAYFGTRHPTAAVATRFGLLIGTAVYVPQNLLNLILLQPVHVPLVVAWVGAGLIGSVVSVLTFRAVVRPPS
ncbi:MAG: hypothetical protein HY207_01365 [Nitrospirae bacterium]|nr:hypothetical protein [Nitrospirota bacterium]